MNFWKNATDITEKGVLLFKVAKLWVTKDVLNLNKKDIQSYDRPAHFDTKDRKLDRFFRNLYSKY